MNKIIKQIKNKVSPDKIAAEVIKNPKLIPELIKVMETEPSALKFGCEKVVRLVGQKKPELVYPYFDRFVKLLDHENNFLKWGAILTLANLTRVDTKHKFERIFKKYYAPVKGPVMITAANIVGGSVEIIKNKPELTDKIVQEILKIEKARYEIKGQFSPECQNVIYGHAINTFTEIFPKIKNQEPVVSFVKKQLKNTRPAVRKKAEKFVNKYF